MTDTALRLADVLGYRPDGTLFWKIKAGNGRIAIGTTAGFPTVCGGFKVMFQKKAYWVHHVVWALHTGHMPTKFVDHINGIRSDNRFENLRECTQAENMQNRSAVGIGASRLLGVHRYRNGKWASAITKNGQKQWLGVFDTPQEASEAYLSAKRRTHTFNPEPRK